MNKSLLLTSYRVFFALLGFSAVVAEIATLVERSKFNPFNFFSFFTIQANLIAVVILIISALALTHHNQSRSIALLRGANTFNMIVVGVVFSVLLSGLDAELTAVAWNNTVLHYIMPAAVALDWLMDRPKLRIPFKSALLWMIFPMAYLVYSLIRGHFVNWYPYPFLNPSEHGYMGIAITSAVIAAGATALAWIMARLTGLTDSKKSH